MTILKTAIRTYRLYLKASNISVRVQARNNITLLNESLAAPIRCYYIYIIVIHDLEYGKLAQQVFYLVHFVGFMTKSICTECTLSG